MNKTIDHLLKSLRDAAVYNKEVQVAPACILWPDCDCQWKAVIPRLQNEMPELLVLGNYMPEQRTGPAIWLRCVIAGKIDQVPISESQPPIIYLPGISRQDIRAVENCAEHLKPLAELQYSGTIWSQVNTKDWTILAYLKSDQGGLGLDVAQDNKTKNAMQLSLYRLLEEDISMIKGKHLDKDYFNTLLTSGDPVRDLLQWIDQEDAYKSSCEQIEWLGFLEICKSQFAFNPENDGVLTGAAKLAGHKGPWNSVWDRFCEAPHRYPKIPEKIRQCKMPDVDLLSNSETHGTWPQWNESKENNLRNSLLALEKLPAHEARERIINLDKKHRDRRKLIWSEIGESQLVLALKHLANLAEYTKQPIAGGTSDDLMGMYCNFGWKTDAAVVSALSYIDRNDNMKAMITAIRSVYLEWLEESARYFQKLIGQSEYPAAYPVQYSDGSYGDQKAESQRKGECILFVDGLRFDLAKRLIAILSRNNYHIEEKPTWAALPTVTSTCKPSISPVKNLITGNELNKEFEPNVKETGHSLKGGYHFKKLLKDNNWIILNPTEFGDGKGSAWCEFGNIDHEGHQRGWKLAPLLDNYLIEIAEHIKQLFLSGWQIVRVVSDHGWLLLPGELPKTELPGVLVENKWGRCAIIKEGAKTNERTYPWYWNPNEYVALADGVSCYKKGEEYAHGGLSLQECLTLEMTITPAEADEIKASFEITDIVWKGLRCKIALEGTLTNLSLDIRTQAGNPSTSVVMSIKPVKESGIGSVVVDNGDFEGDEAFIVLINENKDILAQMKTIIGGDNQ